ncbi:hypothetical protein pipiens_019940, partial [Culex pipiens pipiens]
MLDFPVDNPFVGEDHFNIPSGGDGNSRARIIQSLAQAAVGRDSKVTINRSSSRGQRSDEPESDPGAGRRQKRKADGGFVAGIISSEQTASDMFNTRSRKENLRRRWPAERLQAARLAVCCAEWSHDHKYDRTGFLHRQANKEYYKLKSR